MTTDKKSIDMGFGYSWDEQKNNWVLDETAPE